MAGKIGETHAIVVSNTALVGGTSNQGASSTPQMDYDGEVFEIVANVLEPTDTGTNNTKELFPMVAAQVDFSGNPMTDNVAVPITALGGSGSLPGRDWKFPFKKGDKLNAKFTHLGTGAAPTLRADLTFRYRITG